MAEDRQGHVWFGTNQGLSRYRDGRFDLFTVENGLGSNQIRSIRQTRDGTLWVGTSSGLGRFDGQRFHAIEALSHQAVYAIHEDEAVDGLLWLGTSGNGVVRLEGDQSTAFTTEVGFFDDLIRGILEDDFGWLWIATSRGIIRVSKEALTPPFGPNAGQRPERIPFVHYGERDGMKSSACYGGHPAGIKTRDGRIWLSTLNGVVVVDPSTLSNAPAPAVIVEGLWVDGEPAPDPPILPPGGKSYRIEFTAPTLLVPDKISLRSRLRGFEDTWRDAEGPRVARYSNLAPGDYAFEVMASDESGHWNGPITQFAFTVQPAFRQTIVFYTLCGLGIALLGFGLHRFRLRHLSRQQQRLNQRIEEAVANVNRLQGLLPICASCKKFVPMMDIGSRSKPTSINARKRASATAYALAVRRISFLS